MPQGRRKVPFSAKQKKMQLQQKRDRKNQTETANDDNSNDDFKIVESGSSRAECVRESEVTKVNQQPFTTSVNRFNLMFTKESKAEINKRKEEARNPIHNLPEDTLEVAYHEFYKDSLEKRVQIPKRPAWDYSLSKDKLLALEERYFREYLINLEKCFGQNLSYMELNLETWRQLWRVLEMSDIILVIADIRHPVLHFSPALYEHITKDLKKDVILVLNKIDLVPPSLVAAWKRYFQTIFADLSIVCLTSFAGAKKKAKRRIYKLANGIPQQILLVCKGILNNAVDLKSWESKISSEMSDEAYGGDDDEDEIDPLATATVNIVQNDTTYYASQRFSDGILTIGLVGHPNVGKSSVLNAIMGKKVVSVSRTPGHTKHFQTIFLTNNVKLCDCPGLVFPSLAPKQLQVLSGCYPIAQVREPFSVVGYISQYIPLTKILKITHPEGEEKWSAYDVCEAWALKRGYLTAKSGRPDVHKAANHILRMALDGRTICLAFFPPEYVSKKLEWEKSSDANEIEKQSRGPEAEKEADAIVSSESSNENEEEAEASSKINKFSILAEDSGD